ncbi:MAG: hypothetical protein ACI9KE_000335 [Polyangiales bacterium]
MLRYLVVSLLTLSLACDGQISENEPPITVPPEIPDRPARPPDPFEAAEASLPRLTAVQYQNTLEDILGPTPPVELEADTNPYLFFNIGNASTTVSERGVSQYDEAGHAIAASIFSNTARREALVGCNVDEAACREAFIRRIGRQLFRRPLDVATTTRWTAMATELGEGDNVRGLRYVLAGMLQSPNFLYRPEIGTPSGAGESRLDGYEIASKLSFLFWNTGPDDALLDAAEAGELDDEAGVYEHAMRLLEDERSRSAVQDFFAQYFDLSRLGQLDLDSELYPQYTDTLGESMRTEIELRVADVVFGRDGDVRELFFSRNSFVNAELANLYGISPEGVSPILYVPVELPPERAGLLTSGAFLAMNAHPTETSPTLRGKFVRERVLCQEVQPPPDDVDTDIPPAMETGPQTLRERLVEHRNNPACSSCHAFLDPPGFLFEHYDSVGAWRDREPNGEIDASGGLDDVDLDGATDLAMLLRDDPRVPRCIIKQLYRHTMGRLDEEIEAEALYDLETEFAATGYRFRDLLVLFATSEAFRTVSTVDASEVSP